MGKTEGTLNALNYLCEMSTCYFSRLDVQGCLHAKLQERVCGLCACVHVPACNYCIYCALINLFVYVIALHVVIWVNNAKLEKPWSYCTSKLKERRNFADRNPIFLGFIKDF